MNHIEPVITLKELSRLSGFSISTVSKTLNNKLDISLKTRKEIQNTAEAHNYVPNNYAVALRKKRTKTISVIIPDAITPLFSCCLYNIQKIAYSFGYRIFLFQSFEEDEKEAEFLRSSNDGSVDGVILLSKNKPKINAYYKSFNNPIKHIQIIENQSQEQLQNNCVVSFNALLKNIA